MADCSTYNAFVAKVGISLLDELNLEDSALTRDNYMISINLLREGGVLILGGEAYYRKANTIVLAFHAWATFPEPGQAFADACFRSYEEAIRFIDEFTAGEVDKQEVLFSLMPLCPPVTLAGC
jgi:hypothetical protein